jgi:predicted transcriptional regulator
MQTKETMKSEKTTIYRFDKRRSKIPENIRLKIIHHFETEMNNTVPDIMKALNLEKKTVNSVIDKYLKEKFEK